MQESCHCLLAQTHKNLWACSRLVQSAAPAVHSPRWLGWPPLALWKGHSILYNFYSSNVYSIHQYSPNFFKSQNPFTVNFSNPTPTPTHTTHAPFSTKEIPWILEGATVCVRVPNRSLQDVWFAMRLPRFGVPVIQPITVKIFKIYVTTHLVEHKF